MQRFKKGDPVWIVHRDRFGFPSLHHRPGKIVRRVHPTCYVIATVISPADKPHEQWRTTNDGTQRHPADLLPHGDEQRELRELVGRWREETPPDIIAARNVYLAECAEANRRLTRAFAPLFSFVNKETKRRLRR